jgi:hypothetical protein
LQSGEHLGKDSVFFRWDYQQIVEKTKKVIEHNRLIIAVRKDRISFSNAHHFVYKRSHHTNIHCRDDTNRVIRKVGLFM